MYPVLGCCVWSGPRVVAVSVCVALPLSLHPAFFFVETLQFYRSEQTSPYSGKRCVSRVTFALILFVFPLH